MTLNTHYRKASDYLTYRLDKRTHGRRESANPKIAKLDERIEVQLNSNEFSGKDPISILSFLPDFQAAGNTNGIHEET